MKFVIAVLCSVLFLGLYTDLVSACAYMSTESCIRGSVNCDQAAVCNRESMGCGHTEACYNSTRSCGSTRNIMEYCTRINGCTKPFQFLYAVKDHCQPPLSAGAPTLKSFAIMVASLLTVLF